MRRLRSRVRACVFGLSRTRLRVWAWPARPSGVSGNMDMCLVLTWCAETRGNRSARISLRKYTAYDHICRVCAWGEKGVDVFIVENGGNAWSKLGLLAAPVAFCERLEDMKLFIEWK